MSELQIRPQRLWQFLGGKYGLVVACPVFHLPAWRNSEKEYVHAAVIKLDHKNNPKLEIEHMCKEKR